ncbi:unnamed protein product, partial [Didymodactylos carnosus]
MRYCVTALLE